MEHEASTETETATATIADGDETEAEVKPRRWSARREGLVPMADDD